MADVNITLRSKAELQSFRSTYQEVEKVKVSLSGLNEAGLKLGFNVLSVQGAFNLLKNEVRHVIDNIGSIPGVPAETVDSINRSKLLMTETRGVVDGWIANGLTVFTQIGEGIGLLAGSIVHGHEAAVDSYLATQRAADAAATAAETAKQRMRAEADAAKQVAEEQRAAAKAVEEYRSAMASLTSSYAAESRVGETLGGRVDRLRGEVSTAEAKSKNTSGLEQIAAETAASKARVELSRAELELNQRLSALGEAQNKARFDSLSLEAKILEVKRDLAAAEERAKSSLDGTATTEERIVAAAERALELKRQLSDLEASRPVESTDSGGSAADPYAQPMGISGGLQSYVDDVGNMQANLAEGAYSIANAFEQGVGNAIEGLINQTMTWKQALASIGQTILSSIVTAFAKMVAQYAASRLAMFILNKLFGAKETATSALQATASAVAWAPAATAASIASFGAAAALGTAAFLSALGLGTAGAAAIAAAAGGAAVVGSRALGGPVQAGAPYLVGEYGPEIVVPDESAVVMNHRETAALAGTLARGSSGAGGASGGGSSRPMNVALIDNRAIAEQMRRSSDVETYIVEVMQRNKYAAL